VRIMEKKFNADIYKSIFEFENLINEIIPRRLLYRVIFRGRGLDFDGYRKYYTDEDSSVIDWKASLRNNSLLARQYIEERDLRVIFIIDMSENMVFGSQEKLKCEYAAEVAASFSHILNRTGDKFGFILFNKDIFTFSLPSSGKKQHDNFVFELINPDNYKGNYYLSHILEKITTIIDSSIDMLVFISDFLKLGKEHFDKFNYFGSLYESIAISIKDPLDVVLPEINKEIIIQDSNTGEKILINPSVVRKVYEKHALEQIHEMRDMFQKSNIDILELYTDEDYKQKLAYFLKRRAEKRLA